MNVPAVLLLFLATLLPTASLACTNWQNNVPHAELMPEYTRIVEGEVVAIHLVEYERVRKPQIERNDPDPIIVVDSTPKFNIRVLVTRRHKGKAPSVLKLSMGGCGVSVPSPASRALFFYHPELGVQAVFESADPAEFAEWQDHLKVNIPQ